MFPVKHIFLILILNKGRRATVYRESPPLHAQRGHRPRGAFSAAALPDKSGAAGNATDCRRLLPRLRAGAMRPGPPKQRCVEFLLLNSARYYNNNDSNSNNGQATTK
jgi:hypothetical protein